MNPKIVVVGSANTDFVVLLPVLPGPGETVLGGKFLTARGGKGANQAVAAARLGAQVTLVARLGNDSLGQEALEAYRQEGIDTRYVGRDTSTPSGVALILVNEKGENMIAVASGANACLSPEDIYAAEPAFSAADCLLLQLEVPIETVRAAIELAYQRHIKVILNPAPAAAVPADLLQKVTVLTPNEVELRTLANWKDAPELEGLAVEFYRRSGVQELVVTLGSRGALMISDGARIHVPAFPVQPVDTTACGDAFSAALTVRLGQGAALPDAVRYACGAGALAATRQGAQPSLPRADELDHFLLA